MYKLISLLFLLSIYSFICNSQETKYGSNEGKYLNLNDTKIYYEEYGSGMPLLMLHGGFGSIHDFQNVISELSNHFRVIAVDSPGHGRSEQSDSLSFDLMADCFSEMIDILQLDSVYIIGYSDGGITGLILAARRSDKVKKVIASGANSRMDEIVPEVLGYLKMLNPEFIEANQKEWLDDFKSRSPEKDKWKKYLSDILKMYSKNETISDKILSDIGSEVLLVYGDKDAIKLEHGIELYHKIKGSSLCILPNTPHEVFSVNPVMINKIGIDFLSK